MDRIAILGAGNVGGALYRSLKGVMGEDALFVCDTHEGQLAKLGARHACREAEAAGRPPLTAGTMEISAPAGTGVDSPPV